LVAKIDEGHRPALAAQLKVEDAALECQRFLNVPDLQRYVVEADGARLCGANHSTLLLSVGGYLVRTAQIAQPSPQSLNVTQGQTILALRRQKAKGHCHIDCFYCSALGSSQESASIKSMGWQTHRGRRKSLYLLDDNAQ
jgi:hypothetical protein